jgi:hypothetical protein
MLTRISEKQIDYSSLRWRTLRFTPKAALRTDSPNPPTMEKSTDRFVAIDYQLLQTAWRNFEAKRQAAPQVGGGTPSVGESLEATRAAKARARSTEALAQEVDTLKQELQSTQKQLGSQNQQQK